jgi:hypothetical protein
MPVNQVGCGRKIDIFLKYLLGRNHITNLNEAALFTKIDLQRKLFFAEGR